MGGRQAATLLTKASWTLGGLFMGLALLLAILSARARAPSSILEGQIQAPAQEPTPTPLLDREQQEGAAVEGLEIGTPQTGSEGSAEEETPPEEGGNQD